MRYAVFSLGASVVQAVTVEAATADAAVRRAVDNIDDFVIGPTWAMEGPVSTTEEKIRKQLAMPVDMGDAPVDLPKLLARIGAAASTAEVLWWNTWADKQQTCTVITRHHGRDGLTQVLRAIAEASVRTKTAMSSRVRSIADFYEIG